MPERLLKEGVFIIHALKGYEFHEKRIKDYFRKNELSYEFVTDGDPLYIDEEKIKKYFSSNINNILSPGVLSCTLNHIYAYEKMKVKGLKYAIIFENDPFFLGDFKKMISRIFDEMEKLPPGFIISLENSTLRFPSYWQTKKGKYIYRAKSGRMAGAYVIDLEGTRRILNDLNLNKCNTVIDWWHNNLVERDIVRMYWAHPPMVEQGSHNGRLNSTISSKPDTMIRRTSWLVQKLYKYYFKRIFNEKKVM